MIKAMWLDCPVCGAPAFEAVPCQDCGDEECVCDGEGWVWYETDWELCVSCSVPIRVVTDDGLAQVDYDEWLILDDC